MTERGFKRNSISQFNNDFYEELNSQAKVGELMSTIVTTQTQDALINFNNK